MKRKIKPKTKKHIHSFQIERAGADPKTGYISFFDMRCECGQALFVTNPTTHRGDEPERRIQFNRDRDF